ncbi:hypothetical protein GGH94_003801 [Coemansia aciculifera]|uniref:P-loop containing nucleoside triphosphate hydrolase protein n=1 Tax=Coemansia aciculifera TaxID=417176 RepID=A0A9W8M5V5_9FUNG|nr:hypothetical protein GGH94_003801 [Coemansia aciculifera]
MAGIKSSSVLYVDLTLHVLGSLIVLGQVTSRGQIDSRAYVVSAVLFAAGAITHFDNMLLVIVRAFVPILISQTRQLPELPARRPRSNSPTLTMLIPGAIAALLAIHWSAELRDIAYCHIRGGGCQYVLHICLLIADVWLLVTQCRLLSGLRTKNNPMPEVASPPMSVGPEDTEPLLSRLTYHWVLRSLRSTANVTVPQPPASMDPHSLLLWFNSHWQRQITCGQYPLAHTLGRAFASDLCLASGLRLIVYVNDVALPILVARMLRELSVNTFSMPHALTALSTYSVLSVVATVIEQNQIDLKDKVKLKIRIALTTAVHQSMLAGGSLTNSSVEAQRLDTDMYSCGIRNTQQLATHIVNLTGAIWLPVRVTAGLYVFYRQVGWAVVPGIAIVLLYLPLRKLLVSRSTRAQAQAAKASSQRVGLLTQLVENIIPLRMLGWDCLLADRIQELREHDELKFTVESNMATSLLSFVRTACRSGGPLGSLFIYSVYYYLTSNGNGDLYVTADQVYIVQAILRELFPLLIDVPHAFDSWWAARRPYEQIEGLLLLQPETSRESRSSTLPASAAIQIVNGTFTWASSTGADRAQTLSIPKLDVTQGQLIAVVGKVGAGKSSLLLALLGEMKQTGEVLINHKLKFAHVSQIPWLMSTTIRDNILFGLPYDETWFTKVIDVCELQHDIDHLVLRDQTIVGNGGMALSGGQRMRVALARAVYARPQVILLDDILASVDANVSRRLVDRVLSPSSGLLTGSTCIVVTQSPAVLAIAHGVCVVSKGQVSGPRTLNELLSDASTDFCAIAGISTVEPPVLAEPLLLATPPNSSSLRSATIDKGSDDNDNVAVPATSLVIKAQSAYQWQQYLVPVRYMLRLCGGSVVALHCLTVAAQCIASRKAQLWLAKPIPLAHEHTDMATQPWHPTMWHFAMCAAWWAADVTLELGGQWWTEVVWRRSMFVKSHGELLSSTAGAPLSFFASMPLGRILSLFTDSQQDVDTRMPQRLANLATFAVKLAFESWVILTFHPALVASIVAVIIAMRYIVTASRGPLAVYLAAQTDARPMIDEQYQEALAGAQTIRAFGAHDYAAQKLSTRVSAFVGAQRAGDCVETWIDMAMSLLRCAVTSIAFAIALLGAANGVSIDPTYMSLVYWSITFLLARIQHLVRHSHALHSSLDRAARFIEFTDMESEADIRDRKLKKDNVPEHWPDSGAIVFNKVCARYGTPSGGVKSTSDKVPAEHALNQMSFTIEGGQHVGIVGRTGAGKTSIAMALLGLLSPESGTITIDSIDITSIALDTLRERLAVVPQSAPVLQGTVRFNVDPRSAHSDDEILCVLDAVGLSECCLDNTALEAWSIGQRQLLSVARAMLKQSRVLILDEATASIDPQTNRRLHAVIRQKFMQCTVIVIAHRLETIYDCDQILVIDGGQVCEQGSPAALLANPKSRFALMAATNTKSQAMMADSTCG